MEIYRTKLGRYIYQVGRASYRRAPTTVGVVRYISSDIFLKNCDIFLREREEEGEGEGEGEEAIPPATRSVAAGARSAIRR